MKWLRVARSFLRDYGDALSLTALAAALFGVATNTQTGWLYLFCAFLLAALAYHRILGKAELRELRLTLVACPWRTRVGEEGEWSWRAHAPRARFRYPLLVEILPQVFEPAGTPSRFLAWNEAEQEFRCFTRMVRRGPVGGLEIRVHSWAPFAWFSTRRELSLRLADQEVLVLPRGPQLDLEVLPSNAAREGSSSISGRSGQWGDLRRLRDYVSGDDPRWVHWATTARLGRLVVREHSLQSAQKLTVLVDGRAGEQLERLISWAAALIDWAPRRGYEVHLCLNGSGRYQPQSEPLEALARIPAGGFAAHSGSVPEGLPGSELTFWFTMEVGQAIPERVVVLDFSGRTAYAVPADAHPTALFREAMGRVRR